MKRTDWDEMLQIREEVYFTKGRIDALLAEAPTPIPDTAKAAAE